MSMRTRAKVDLNVGVLCIEASGAVVNLAALFTALVGPWEVEDGNEEERVAAIGDTSQRIVPVRKSAVV